MALLVGALSWAPAVRATRRTAWSGAVDKELSDLDRALDAGDEAERQESDAPTCARCS